MPSPTHSGPETRFGDFIGRGRGHEKYPVDVDLCDLMRTMKLGTSYEKGNTTEDILLAAAASPPNVQDDLMSEYPNPTADVVLKRTQAPQGDTSQGPSYGCAYLRSIRSRLEDYPTTGGEYLDAIFTHRDILHSYPAVHRDCARGFSDLAYLLEKRAWRSDRDADVEAVTAFRHEAWVIASTLSPERNVSRPSFICVIPMM